MGRKNKIEAHPDSKLIIERIKKGDEFYEIHKDYPIIEWGNFDHYKNVVLPRLAAQAKRRELPKLKTSLTPEEQTLFEGDDFIGQIRTLHQKAMEALEGQDPAKDAKSWALVSRETRGYLELLGKALDKISDSPNVQVNVLVNPQWIELRTLIADTLEAYPDAREAVINAIGRRRFALQDGPGIMG